MKKFIASLVLIVMAVTIFTACGKSEYKVRFDVGTGVSNAPAEQVVPKGGYAEVPAIEPTKDGSTFGGWFTSSSYVKEFEFDLPINKNTTVYAKWNAGAGLQSMSYYSDYYNLGNSDENTADSQQNRTYRNSINRYRKHWMRSGNPNEIENNEFATRVNEMTKQNDTGRSGSNMQRYMRSRYDRTYNNRARNNGLSGTYGAKYYGAKLNNTAKNTDTANNTVNNDTSISLMNAENTNNENTARAEQTRRSISRSDIYNRSKTENTAENSRTIRSTSESADAQNRAQLIRQQQRYINRDINRGNTYRTSRFINKENNTNETNINSNIENSVSRLSTENTSAENNEMAVKNAAGITNNVASMPRYSRLPAPSNMPRNNNSIYTDRYNRNINNGGASVAPSADIANNNAINNVNTFTSNNETNNNNTGIALTRPNHINNASRLAMQNPVTRGVSQNSFVGTLPNSSTAGSTENINNFQKTLSNNDQFQNNTVPGTLNFASNNPPARNYYVNYVNGENTTREMVSAGECVNCYSINPTSVNGKTFGGWYMDSNCTVPFNQKTPVNSNMNVYAKWSPSSQN